VYAVEPLQLYVATLRKLGSRPGDELAYEVGHEQLASERLAATRAA
jgi:hypothetical protein